MAKITPINFAKEGSPLDFANAQSVTRIADRTAAVKLTAGTLVYINSDGKVAKSDGKIVHGITVKDAAEGEPITVFGPGVRLRYAAGLTPGATLYAGADGEIHDAATADDKTGTLFAVSATDIVLTRYKLTAESAS